MIGYSLLVTSAALHALWNFILKHQEKKDFAIIAIVAVAAISSMLLSLIFGPSLGSSQGFLFAFAAGIFEGLYFLSLTRALQEASLSSSYLVMRGGAMLIVWSLSVFFVHERLSGLTLAGLSLILTGLATIHAPKSLNKLRWSYAAGTCIALYHMAYDQALKGGAEPITLFSFALLVSLAFILAKKKNIGGYFFEVIKSKRSSKILIAGLAMSGSFALFLYGLKLSAPGYAISLRNSSIVFALLLSYGFGQRPTKAEVIGMVIIFSGLFCLGLT